MKLVRTGRYFLTIVGVLLGATILILKYMPQTTIDKTAGPPPTVAFDHSLKPRVPGRKLTLAQMEAMPAGHGLEVKFREGRMIRLVDKHITGLSPAEAIAFEHAVRVWNIMPILLSRETSIPEKQLDTLREGGEKRSGQQLADMNLYYSLAVLPGFDGAKIADNLNQLDFIEFAQPRATPASLP